MKISKILIIINRTTNRLENTEFLYLPILLLLRQYRRNIMIIGRIKAFASCAKIIKLVGLDPHMIDEKNPTNKTLPQIIRNFTLFVSTFDVDDISDIV